MNYLLDTHTFLWMVSDPDKLSNNARSILRNKNNNLIFSVASAWEIIIKQQIGKLAIHKPIEDFLRHELSIYKMELLSIEFSHILNLSKLPNHHKDPFDRILISQSKIEKYPLITDDKLVKKYKIETIW